MHVKKKIASKIDNNLQIILLYNEFGLAYQEI